MGEDRIETRVSIEIDKHPDQMRGDMMVERQQGNTKVLFVPTKPDWATETKMEAEITVKDTSYKTRAKTIPTLKAWPVNGQEFSFF